jgi:MoaA/NifB/PqqE/SkfB family radical SAM enzyme
MSDISQKSVQHGLEHRNTGKLQTMWLEVPPLCNLFCSYCYANGGKVTLDEMERWLTRQQYLNILDQASAQGVDSIGIPGAGEPLLPGKGCSNRIVTLQILHRCAELGIFVTIFTTGEFIDEELANELLALPCELMLKGNSLRPHIQDRFVSNPDNGVEHIRTGFGARRNKVLNMLMQKGFNTPAYRRKSRLALVTSIMADDAVSNVTELPELLRFCRRNNIIFDCDTILRQGRGIGCHLSVEDETVKAVLTTLQAIDWVEFGNHWEISQSYVGTTCDRCFHHLYVNHCGDIRPCIGAEGVKLGNIRDITLAEAWNSPVMKLFRARRFGGVCGKDCLNFEEGTCNSCIGRRSPAGTTGEMIVEQGEIPTIGCWNTRPKGRFIRNR